MDIKQFSIESQIGYIIVLERRAFQCWIKIPRDFVAFLRAFIHSFKEKASQNEHVLQISTIVWTFFLSVVFLCWAVDKPRKYKKGLFFCIWWIKSASKDFELNSSYSFKLYWTWCGFETIDLFVNFAAAVDCVQLVPNKGETEQLAISKYVCLKQLVLCWKSDLNL